MTDTQRAKAMLPNMPTEVFDIWIAPLVASAGWPFYTPNDLNIAGSWSQYLRRKTVEQINNLVWRRRQVPCDLRAFQPDTREIIKLVILAYAHGNKAALAKVGRVKNGRGGESFLRSYRFIERTGRLYTDVVLLEYPNGFQIADGAHRIGFVLRQKSTALFPDLGGGNLTVAHWCLML